MYFNDNDSATAVTDAAIAAAPSCDKITEDAKGRKQKKEKKIQIKCHKKYVLKTKHQNKIKRKKADKKSKLTM